MRPVPILFALICFSLSFASAAVELQSGVILNTTGSNSSMTFNCYNVTIDEGLITENAIWLSNVSYNNTATGLMVNVTPRTFNWTTPNSNLDSCDIVSPTITIISPVHNSQTQNFNVLFNISVGGIANSTVLSRWYSLDHGIINTTLPAGGVIVNSPAGSYHPFFCASGSIGNTGCSSEINFDVLGIGDVRSTSGGGGGGAGGQPSQSTSITLASINVSSDSEWFYGSTYAIGVQTFDINGQPFDGASISIEPISNMTYANASILRMGIGSVEKSFKVESAVNHSATFRIVASQGGKTVEKSITVSLSEGTFTQQTFLDLKAAAVNAANTTRDNPIVMFLVFFSALGLITFIIYASRSKGKATTGIVD